MFEHVSLEEVKANINRVSEHLFGCTLNINFTGR
jgi:hypothetical protein